VAHTLEICVDSVAAAVAATRAGADRIELCRDLSDEGLTPTDEAMNAALARVRIPIYAIVRPRAGDFCYSATEFAAMARAIHRAKQIGVHGIVLGILDGRGRVDSDRTARLVDLARPLPVTFHRAFDRCPCLVRALEDVVTTGAARVLTSGGPGCAIENLAMLRQLVQCAAGRIVVMPGGGIRASNIARVGAQTGAEEMHSSARSKHTSLPTDQSLAALEEQVRTMRRRFVSRSR
jgi:copper homeostasis protein